MASLYHQDVGEQVDGVLAVDLTALRLLLQALGPIQVPGYDDPVTNDNLESMIMSFWEAPRLTAPGRETTDWWLHRKDLAGDLMAVLLPTLVEQHRPDALDKLAGVIAKALMERHLLIYVNNPHAQAISRRMGWDAALRPVDGDYLMIVDSNVGFNKVNPNIEQRIDYQIELDETGTATSQLTLTYRHRIQHPTEACVHESHYGEGYADLMERCYWDHLRIYLPAGSELLEALGVDEPPTVYEESGKMVIATSFLLATGQERQIRLVYRPALAMWTGRYALLVQKQPGTGALPLRVGISSPDGARPTTASPDGMVWLDGRVVWQGGLAQDREIRLSWE
jgi:hypothetical protein